MFESRKSKAMNNEKKDDRKPFNGDIDRGLSEELQLLEAQLKLLKPLPDRLDREKLIFLAGQASVSDASATLSTHTSRWQSSTALWPGSFAAMTVVAATLLLMLLTQTPNSPSPKIPENNLTIIESPHQSLDVKQHSRAPRRNILSLSPYQLNNLDRLLGHNSLDSLPSNLSTNSNSPHDLINRKILTPTSINMLLDESAEFERSPLDSVVPSQNTGSNS